MPTDIDKLGALDEGVSSVDSGLSIDNIERLYRDFGASILLRCRQLLRNEDAAWDATHQTFLNAIRFRHTFRRESEPLAWLHKIAFRVCIDKRRRESRQRETQTAIDPDQIADWHSLELSVQQKLLTEYLLDTIGRRTQEIVVMRYFDEMEIQQIARQLSISPRTVNRRLQRFVDQAKRRLKRMIP
ncbi:MAG: sigma-70 family RNA polymerase sigma factor [Myxococcota bacterium]